MKIWVITDRHHDHENIKKFEGRPDNFTEIIIKNWQKVVAPKDLVIDLGDVIFGVDKNRRLPEIMAQLPGKKVLCRGNHDDRGISFYLDAGFDMVTDYFVYDSLAFSHAPLTPLPYITYNQRNAPDKFALKQVALNIHGHFHRGLHRANGEAYEDKYYDHQYYMKNKQKYKLVQIEDELRPFNLEELLK